MFATYRKLPLLGDATKPLGPCFAPAFTCPLSFSTPVVVLRVNDDTMPSLKLVTNASAPVPAVEVAVGVAEPPLPLPDGVMSPLLLVHDTVLSIAAMITTAGISRMTFLSAFRRDEDSRLRCSVPIHPKPLLFSDGQSDKKTTASLISQMVRRIEPKRFVPRSTVGSCLS